MSMMIFPQLICRLVLAVAVGGWLCYTSPRCVAMGDRRPATKQAIDGTIKPFPRSRNALHVPCSLLSLRGRGFLQMEIEDHERKES